MKIAAFYSGYLLYQKVKVMAMILLVSALDLKVHSNP